MTSLKIIGIFGLGVLDFVYSKTWFIVVSFVSKFLLGVGSGMNSTASKFIFLLLLSVISIVTSIYNSEKERYIGYIESSAGVGLLIGPIIGTIFYSIGGYIFPFAMLALCYFIIYPLITLVLFKLKKFEADSPRKPRGDKKPVKQLDLLKNSRFFFCMNAQIVVFTSLTFIMPTLSIYL